MKFSFKISLAIDLTVITLILNEAILSILIQLLISGVILETIFNNFIIPLNATIGEKALDFTNCEYIIYCITGTFFFKKFDRSGTISEFFDSGRAVEK
jgi:hypothetical protein